MESHDAQVDVVEDAPPANLGKERPLNRSQAIALANRAWLIIAGIIVPTCCLTVGFPEQPAWQSGNLEAYAQLLASRPASTPMYPFLLYSMVCLALFVFAEGRFAKYFSMRLGVYSGALLATHHWILIGCALAGIQGLAAMLVVAIGASIAGFILWGLLIALATGNSQGAVYVKKLLCVVAVIATYLVLGFALSEIDVHGVFFLPIGILFGAAVFSSTTWAVAAYVMLSVRIRMKNSENSSQFTLGQLMGVTTWFAGYLAAWKTAVAIMWYEYAKLPTESPEHCYVCTAASRGHPWLVGRCQATSRDGATYGTNQQTLTLRRFERDVLSQYPRGHRVLRAVYNRVGPRLASMLFCPILADLAYLSLKPAEWTARLVLRHTPSDS